MTEKEQFEYGEWVGVRDDESHVWVLRQYIDTVEFGNTGIKAYCIFLDDENPDNHSGHGRCYRQIRKHVPEPVMIEIEQPEQGTIEYLQGQIHTLNKRLMALENELHIKSMNKPVKNIK